MDEILEALENAAPIRQLRHVSPQATADKHDVAAFGRVVLRFLEELDEGLSVREVVEVLRDSYGKAQRGGTT